MTVIFILHTNNKVIFYYIVPIMLPLLSIGNPAWNYFQDLREYSFEYIKQCKSQQHKLEVS